MVSGDIIRGRIEENERDPHGASPRERVRRGFESAERSDDGRPFQVYIWVVLLPWLERDYFRHGGQFAH